MFPEHMSTDCKIPLYFGDEIARTCCQTTKDGVLLVARYPAHHSRVCVHTSSVGAVMRFTAVPGFLCLVRSTREQAKKCCQSSPTFFSGLPTRQVLRELKAAPRPHTLELLRYDMNFNRLTLKWETLEEVRQQGKYVRDAREEVRENVVAS